MPKMLSAKAVEHAKPTSTRREIADGLLSGLYLIVQRSGVKSWAVRYRYGGRSKKLTLGRYPAMDVAKARQAGRDALTVAAAGNDPAQQKRIIRKHAAEGRDLVETVVAEFLERHAKAKRSYRELKRMLDREVVPHWRGRKIQDISRRDVIELLDGLMDRGVGRMTNMVFSVVRKLFRWAVERDIVAASPCTGMRPPAPEVSRDRVLADDELRRLWQAADGLGYPFGPMFKLLALTGQRLGEVAGMAWPEIDLEKKLWSLPRQRVKNARAHDVPLSDLAIEILASLPRIGSPKEFVFTTTGETPASGFSRAKRNLDAAMLTAASAASPTIAPFTLHDVRRTVATGMQRLGIAPQVTEAVLNHRSGTIKGVAAVYARYDYASEKRSALESWSSHLSSVLSDYASGTDDGAFRGGHTSS